MRKFLLRIIGYPLQIIVRWYLKKPRTYRYKEIAIAVMPGVFHPGLFFSTQFLLQFIQTQDLRQKSLLELGSGSGLISIVAAKKGARVTAADISETAVMATAQNSKNNNVKIEVIQSNLFNKIPTFVFDWIVINPPYYPAAPKNLEDHAWHCGENHEYFHGLFLSLKNYTDKQSYILMVLSDVCDIPTIISIAAKHNLHFEKIAAKNVWVDGKNYLFRIRHEK